MKKYSIPIMVVFVTVFSLLALVCRAKADVPNFTPDPGIVVMRRPSGVRVTVDPAIIPPNSVGLNEERWVPYNMYGQGSFYWQGQSHLHGTVTVYWKEQVSPNTFGLTWDDVQGVPPKIITFPWQADRYDCKPLKK